MKGRPDTVHGRAAFADAHLQTAACIDVALEFAAGIPAGDVAALWRKVLDGGIDDAACRAKLGIGRDELKAFWRLRMELEAMA